MPFVRTILVLLFVVRALPAGEPLVVAHRGASADAPENTLPAFRLAWEQGADVIEGDFHLTKDGKIVCIHDKDTKRVASANLVVANSTLAELRKLDVGTWKDAKFAGTNMPTLAEVFATVPEGRQIFVEVKCGKEIVPELMREIARTTLEPDQIVVIAFDEEVVREFKRRAPKHRAYWLASFKTDDAGRSNRQLAPTLAMLEDIGADGLDSSNGIPEAIASGVQEAGYEWHVWTVDDVESARRFEEWGAKSITTNVPGRIKRALAKEAAPAE